MLGSVPSSLLTLVASFDHPTWRAAALAGCVASLSLACGGKSNSDVFDDGGSGGSSADGSGGTAAGGTGTGGGSNGTGTGTQGTASSSGGSGGGGGGGSDSGGSGGSSNGSTSASNGSSTTTATVSTSTTGSGTTGSGGGPPDDRCLLPLDGGDCDAAFQRFGYNVDTGRCEEFIYGGCGGNENRFESLEECLAACDPGARTACEVTPDCVIDHGCCGFCDIDSPADLVAVNMKYASFNDTQCQLVDCAYCAPPESIANFGARCNDGTCEVYDVRKSDLSTCATDADCRLRAGLGCCEACGDTNWVAVSTDYELLQKELCSGLSGGCLACAPTPPMGMYAICAEDGHCQVEMLRL